MAFSLGAFRDPEDIRDFDAEPILSVSPPVDLNVGSGLLEPPDENQGSSSSCVAQAWSYYHWQLKRKDYSRRDIYNKIFIPPAGGAYIRDGGLRIVNHGQATRDELSDPTPQTETNMRVPGGTPEQQASDKEVSSYVLPREDIDYIAQAILDFKGAVFGLYLSSNYNDDPTNLKPPSGPNDLGHALYLFDFHLHNGKKCLIAKSSWCGVYNGIRHHIHHINQDYFTNPEVIFNPWTLIPTNLRIYLAENLAKPGEYGLVTAGPACKTYTPAFGPNDLKDEMIAAGLAVNPDGSIPYQSAIKVNIPD